jgi:NAD(P)H-hydrate epimerase
MKWVTREQMQAIDRRAIEEFGIPAIVLMENAGRGVADEAAALRRERALHGPVLVVCGTGNNGGDGLVVHLFCCGDRWKMDRSGPAGVNLTVCERMGLPITDVKGIEGVREVRERLRPGGLVLDALFGIGLTKPPREPQASVIAAINAAGLPVLAVDVPSGLDADTGQPLGVAIRADVTATMACAKAGFRGPGEPYVGRLVVVDIGLPAVLVRATSGLPSAGQ